jgi:hypothetical protein
MLREDIYAAGRRHRNRRYLVDAQVPLVLTLDDPYCALGLLWSRVKLVSLPRCISLMGVYRFAACSAP